jgi:hypothetical protein
MLATVGLGLASFFFGAMWIWLYYIFAIILVVLTNIANYVR